MRPAPATSAGLKTKVCLHPEALGLPADALGARPRQPRPVAVAGLGPDARHPAT
ncbi:MAG: hypothetical protein WDN45_02645 [Caulobacteraceae bacterium]